MRVRSGAKRRCAHHLLTFFFVRAQFAGGDGEGYGDDDEDEGDFYNDYDGGEAADPTGADAAVAKKGACLVFWRVFFSIIVFGANFFCFVVLCVQARSDAALSTLWRRRRRSQSPSSHRKRSRPCFGRRLRLVLAQRLPRCVCPYMLLARESAHVLSVSVCMRVCAAAVARALVAQKSRPKTTDASAVDAQLESMLGDLMDDPLGDASSLRTTLLVRRPCNSLLFFSPAISMMKVNLFSF